MKKKILPPIYFIIFLLASIILNFAFPLVVIMNSPWKYLGIPLIVFGIVLNIWTDNLLKKFKTTVKPDQKPTVFIDSGSFKINRHPMYLGMFLILVGISLILGSITAFISPVIFIIITEIKFIPMEEKNMEKSFGEKYLKYKKKVRRWI
jgi:protein-S-isoprenylcysteine O-methyltransferase Ste14